MHHGPLCQIVQPMSSTQPSKQPLAWFAVYHAAYEQQYFTDMICFGSCIALMLGMWDIHVTALFSSSSLLFLLLLLLLLLLLQLWPLLLQLQQPFAQHPASSSPPSLSSPIHKHLL